MPANSSDGLASNPKGPLPVSPSLAAWSQAVLPTRQVPVDHRVWHITALALPLAAACVGAAYVLLMLINVVTHLAFAGQWSTQPTSPAFHHLGAWVIVVPMIGGILVGLMARYGAKAIRGHGIPEAMEQILINDSKIPLRVTFLKPLSAAISIGTGGPFGAEGPIIATGGALGSVLGQVLHVTAIERKTLLAAGAAAGMTAIFNSPVSAILLAIELLLFEFRPRSLIPVASAVACAAALRQGLMGVAPVFAMPPLAWQAAWTLPVYLGIGVLVGVASIGVTKAVYFVEDAFEHLPLHWMWWPTLGGLAVGLIGYLNPLTLGVGYSNIEAIIGNRWAASTLLALLVGKFLSWVLALGSGTSGGTLAPLFTIGGAMGGLLALVWNHGMPASAIAPGMAALVGMAAMFAGASRAVLTSVAFAFEITGQASAFSPLLCACVGAYAVSCLGMKTTIMTEKIVRRGVRVPAEYSADPLAQMSVAQACSRPVVTRSTDDTVSAMRQWMSSHAPHSDHQGYPVVDPEGRLRGVITRRDVFNPDLSADTRLAALLHRPPVAVTLSDSLRDAADHMISANVGRLVVVDAAQPDRPVGILTRADLLSSQKAHVHQSRLSG